MKRFVRPLAAISSLAMLTSCARIMHPERVGNKSGSLDTIPLVVDILLFIPGLIPGVIALVIDFTTGAIYVGGGQPTTLSHVGREGTIAIKARELPRNSVVHLRLLDADGRILDEDTVDSRGAKPRQRLAVDLATAAQAHPGSDPVPLTLQMQLDDRPAAEYALLMR
jgi:hypothetical protein